MQAAAKFVIPAGRTRRRGAVMMKLTPVCNGDSRFRDF